MEPSFIEYLSKEIGETVMEVSTVSGGDISEAYLLKSTHGSYFCKVNAEALGLDLFKCEQEGLDAISELACLKTPSVISSGKYESSAFLLMEYIEEGEKSTSSMAKLGRSLAEMHMKNAEPKFGWKRDNYIGSLVQKNSWKEDWISFFVEERLEVQLRLAIDNQYLERKVLPSITQLKAFCNDHFPTVKPGLLHGDLWSGNYLISRNGDPYLIDPAVYYGHFEVDLAMTELFGGFDGQFYSAYYEHNPRIPEYVVRRDLYQLYYYLVHLNIFGRSYFTPVMKTIRKYFQ
ncbi:fructosamine kinase family protein [Portibacter lacus]|uniref:Aminoglycoside phosphotransferase n=1 Tax=Portibacter lacus TaxID=1099794 RepID=A0AA37SRW2_9BACT|nr:fructosamine kinase family protein [Portibacter lacus]GLR16895.1 aminoglycoside phosphotransferase [Portibacter lacus]